VPGQATATLRMTIRWWGLRRVIAGPGRTSGAELASDHWLVADAEGKRRTEPKGASPSSCSSISLDGGAPHVALRGDGADELPWNATV
jgi:hypothetical protein